MQLYHRCDTLQGHTESGAHAVVAWLLMSCRSRCHGASESSARKFSAIASVRIMLVCSGRKLSPRLLHQLWHDLPRMQQIEGPNCYVCKRQANSRSDEIR